MYLKLSLFPIKIVFSDSDFAAGTPDVNSFYSFHDFIFDSSDASFIDLFTIIIHLIDFGFTPDW